MIDNQVYEEFGEWWFWDKTWANKFGPFHTREEACEKRLDYYYAKEKTAEIVNESFGIDQDGIIAPGSLAEELWNIALEETTRWEQDKE